MLRHNRFSEGWRSSLRELGDEAGRVSAGISIVVISLGMALVALALFAGDRPVRTVPVVEAAPSLDITKSAQGFHDGGPDDGAREYRLTANNNGDDLAPGDVVEIIDDLDDAVVLLAIHDVHADWNCALEVDVSDQFIRCTLDGGAQMSDQNEDIVLYDVCDTLTRGSVSNTATIYLNDVAQNSDPANPNVPLCDPPSPTPETPSPTPETPSPTPETPSPTPETPSPTPETPTPTGTPDPGSITIIKQVPGTDPQNFSFSDNIPDCSIGTLDDDPGSGTPQSASCDAEAGTYTVSENVPAGWFLDDIDCSGSGDWVIDVGDEEVTITVDETQSVTCTFENDEEEEENPPVNEVESVVVTATPSPVPTLVAEVEEATDEVANLPSAGFGSGQGNTPWFAYLGALLIALGTLTAVVARPRN